MEPMKQIADTTTLLSYVINLSLSFIIAIAGAFVREVYHYKKNNTLISVFRLITSALLTSVIMTAVVENMDISFAVFALITFFFGMWAFSVIGILMNTKYIAIAAKDVLKELGNPLLKGTSNAIDDIRKEIKDEKKEEKKKDENKDDEEEKKEDGKEQKDSNTKKVGDRRTKRKKEETSTIDTATINISDDNISKEELLRQIRKLESQLSSEVEDKS